ncbi:TPA: phage tail tip fiber protein [Enterobacter kobei]
MGQKIITLSGAATDVLYALFFRGALQSGELPSKSGAAQLRELGLAETRLTATAYGKVNHFTFLTAEGQEFAIKHLVNTRFGETVKQEYYSPLGVELECAQKALDEICEEIRSSKAFEKLINGTPIHCQVHITDTMIGDAAVSANYSVKMNVNHGGKLHVAGMAVCIEGDQRKVVFEADRFKVNEAASSIIENAVATSAKMKIRLSDEMKQAVIDAVRESDLFTSLQAASASDLQQAVDDAVGKALRNAVKPGGMILSSFQLCQH